MQKWQSIMQADLGVDLLLFCFFEFIGQAGIYKSESTAGEEMELWSGSMGAYRSSNGISLLFG